MRSGTMRNLIFVLATILPACANSGVSKSTNTVKAENEAKDQIVASFDGIKITMSQLQKEAQDALEQLKLQKMQLEAQYQKNEFRILEFTLLDMINKKIIELEAKKKGVKPEDIEKEIAENIKVSDEELQKTYEEQKTLSGGRIPPFDQVKDRLRQWVETNKREEYFKSLREKYGVKINLKKPIPKIDITGAPSLGPENAPVTIIEFSDFECPFCKRMVETLKQIHNNYKDKVKIVYKHFPLSIHKNAFIAAEASMCAHEQGKFWEMHDKMFEDQANLSKDALISKAESLGLDSNKFKQCLESGKYKEYVKRDMMDGARAGVSGTPAFIINNETFISGAVGYDRLAEAIDQALKQ